MSTELAKNDALRWSIYWLLIISSAASSTGRIATVTGREGETPFLSANDRSRWCMIRAIVDEGSFAIGDIIFDPETGKRRRGWQTIDLVRHADQNGVEHYYSSKPVLMPTLMAGVYWFVKTCTGATLDQQPFYAGRIVLWLCNIPPLVLMAYLLAKIIDRYGTTDWGRIFAVCVVCWGTLLSAFSITLNNHLHGAVCLTIAVYSLLQIASRSRNQRLHFGIVGFFAALTFANELPALSFLALAALVCAVCDIKRTMLCFLPAAAVVIVAMVGLNYLAHESWQPPYAHRSDGPLMATFDGDANPVRSLNVNSVVAVANEKLNTPLSIDAQLEQRLPVNEGDNTADRYVLWDDATQQRFALQIIDDHAWEIRAWNNWYDYPGTYWNAERKQGVDRGEPFKWVYAFNCLVGHHGLFSLTPVWLLTVGGFALGAMYYQGSFRWLCLGSALLVIVCFTFYVFLRPLEDRNYGGVCNGLRWMLWLAPLMSVGMLPALDWLANRRWGRALAVTCLAVSVASAAYTPVNPWTQPWIFDYWTYLQLIDY